MSRQETINLGAGPCALPTSVLDAASKDLLDYQSTGLGITELSHRSKTFQSINSATKQDLRDLLSIPPQFDVLLMQGGGILQFSIVVMNLVNRYRLLNKTPPDQTVQVDYVVTGSWSDKAAQEARRLGCSVEVVLDSRQFSQDEKSFSSIPKPEQWNFKPSPNILQTGQPDRRRKPAFLYYCDNETVNGVEFGGSGLPVSSLPDSYQDVPIVSDMSSNLLTRCIPKALWSRLGVIFAGSQKNLAPAGLTVVIIRKDLMDFDCDASIRYGGFPIPLSLVYKTISDHESLHNTPPMFSIHVCGLVFKDLISKGGLRYIEHLNQRKAELLYETIDRSSGFYINKVPPDSRSRVNVVFNCRGGSEVDEKFLESAQTVGIKQIKGHRSVGGIRASLYNAITLEQVQKLCDLMNRFMKLEVQSA